MSPKSCCGDTAKIAANGRLGFGETLPAAHVSKAALVMIVARAIELYVCRFC